MKVIIELPEELDKERTLDYFYQVCLYDPAITKFKVMIEGTNLIKEKK